jgi:hypothetical protein
LTVPDVPPSPARSRLRRRLIVAVTSAAGLVFFGYGFATLRTIGWRAWPLTLLLCVLVATSWQVALMFARPSRTIRTHTTAGENELSDEASSNPDTREGSG